MSERKHDSKKDKGLIYRVDQSISAASRKLAGKIPRRSFLGRMTSGIVVLGSTSLILKPSKALANCTPSQCKSQNNVSVCYSPWKIVAAESGYSGLVLRKGPSFSADPVTYNNSTSPVVMSVGSEFGRASNNDPNAPGDGCGNPGPRANQNGFLWGYWTGYAKQGWMPYSVGGVTYAVGDNGYTGALCGPANVDFDCRNTSKSNCHSYNGCGGGGISPSCPGAYNADLDAYTTSPSDERFYLRYGPSSTTFAWLIPVEGSTPADSVYVYGNVNSNGYNWSCISVICARWVPNGCRGWIRSDALGTPVGGRTACYPAIACANP